MIYWRTERLQARPLALGDEAALLRTLADWPGHGAVTQEWAAGETAVAALTEPLPALPVDGHRFRTVVERRSDSKVVASTFGTLSGTTWHADFEAVDPDERRRGYYRELRLAGSRFIIERLGVRDIWWKVLAGAAASEGTRHMDRRMGAALAGTERGTGGTLMWMQTTADVFLGGIAGAEWPVWEVCP